MKKYISIDIGGTAIKYGIVSEDAEVLCVSLLQVWWTSKKEKSSILHR